MFRKIRLKTANKLINTRLRPISDDPMSKHDEAATKRLRAIPNARVLEIGSRNVSNVLHRDKFPNAAEYVGFDILEGENVDVVGDAHTLSRYFEPNYFDIVYSSSVFEHLMFPWKVALEINTILKPGGFVLTTTHPAWPEHEMPWDFWRFPQGAFQSLFNPITGYALESVCEGRPMRAFALTNDVPMRNMFKYKINGAVQCLAKKTGDYDRNVVRWDIAPSDIGQSMYPPKK